MNTTTVQAEYPHRLNYLFKGMEAYYLHFYSEETSPWVIVALGFPPSQIQIDQ